MSLTQDYFSNPFNPMRLEEMLGLNNAVPQMPMMPPMPQMGGQAKQQAPEMQQAQENPIERGLSAGMGAGRQSLEMDAAQRDRALGMLIAKMFAGMASSKQGSVLGAMNEGLAGGIGEYENQQAKFMKMNQLEMERQQELNKEAQRQKERREDLEIKREALGIRAGKSGGKSSKNPYHGMTQEAKLMLQQHEIDEGYLPGSNRAVELTPEQQEQYSEINALKMQKITTDADTRKRSIFAENLVKAIDSTNVDDLTRYSGPAGQGRLKIEEAKDLVGKPSPEYIKYKEALTAVQIEAKELRQALGESITPTMSEQLQHLTNPTGFYTSPKTAKKQILKTRQLIQSQMETFKSRLKRPASYNNEENLMNKNQEFINKNDTGYSKGIMNGKSYNIPYDKRDEFIQSGGQINE